MTALRRIAALAAVLCALNTVAVAQEDGSSWASAVSGEAAPSLKFVPAPPAAATPGDVAGVREAVRKLSVSVSRTCAADGPRYVLKPVAEDSGPSLSASGDTLSSDYLYPQANGLQLALSGDAPGAALSASSSGGEDRLLGTVVAPAAEPCSPYPMASVEVRLARGVSAVISVEPRTGIFRPACYKDIINGFYKLDTWTVLKLSFPQETMTVKTKDGMSFRDEPSCRAFYARLK